jgi:hypothetical protein
MVEVVDQPPGLDIVQDHVHPALYHPGGSQPACSTALAQRMIEGGWLMKNGERYEAAEQGLRGAD